jgi:excisionase family DNA binding protein
MKNWLTTKEAAQKVGLTYVRINQLIKEGTLIAEKRGRDYFIKESDLEVLSQRPETRGRKKKSIDDLKSNEIRKRGRPSKKP